VPASQRRYFELRALPGWKTGYRTTSW